MLSALRARFARFACLVTEWTGSFWAFAAALFVIFLWLVSGPIFRFSDTWQLVINTATTIVTFLMVFVIQHAQNRETRAIQLKLDELVKALRGARNELIGAEDLTEDEARELVERYRKLAERAKRRRLQRRASPAEPPSGSAGR